MYLFIKIDYTFPVEALLTLPVVIPRGGQLIVLTSANIDNSSSNSSIFVNRRVMSRQHGVCTILLR